MRLRLWPRCRHITDYYAIHDGTFRCQRHRGHGYPHQWVHRSPTWWKRPFSSWSQKRTITWWWEYLPPMQFYSKKIKW